MDFPHGNKKGIQVNDLAKRIYHHPTSELVVRWILGATFLFASFHKIIAPEDFATAISSYDLFPELSVNLIAITLPAIELLSGVALLFGLYHRGAILLINVMLTAFIIALTINLVRGHEFDCGCFSVSQTGAAESAKLLLLRDVVFWCLGIYILSFKGRRKWCLQKA